MLITSLPGKQTGSRRRRLYPVTRVKALTHILQNDSDGRLTQRETGFKVMFISRWVLTAKPGLLFTTSSSELELADIYNELHVVKAPRLCAYGRCMWTYLGQ